MMMPRYQRLTCTFNTQIEERSLSQLENNLKAFRDNGSRHAHAKNFNNVIHEYLFNIPLSQVNFFPQK
ncbi:MAG: hypothetical protein DSY43_00510 [Gammaproteobacteria bacterium]|nr:MAG: hypothetical protein DSY43_00510 [Gammaproteobacteria bacterium]